MKKTSLSGVKNIIWALAILASLIALFVGLIFSVTSRYSGERESGILTLGQGRKTESVSDDGVIFSSDVDMAGMPGPVIDFPNTQDNGLGAAFSYTYLCDSTLVGINDYSASYGGSAAAELWTDDGSGLPAANAANTNIIYPSDGSLITPSSAAMVFQPKRLVIYIGGDDLASASKESFISGYTDQQYPESQRRNHDHLLFYRLCQHRLPRYGRTDRRTHRSGKRLDPRGVLTHRRILCRPCFPAQR